MAAGFLFSGDVLDDCKETWSDLRDTTCRRFIISFSLSLFFFPTPCFFCGVIILRCRGGRHERIQEDCSHGFIAMFPFRLSSSGLIASTGGVFLRVLVF